MSSVVKRFILLGESGAGKSSFVNIFYNYCYGTRNPDEIFADDQSKVRLAIPCKDWLDRIQGDEKSSEHDINDQTKSQTMDCTSYMLHFGNVTIELIDTPGFNDVNGVAQDDITLRVIEKVLQNISYLSGIIIIANGSITRLGTSFLHFMRMLHQIWPNSLMQNMCAVLTNCDDNRSSLSSQVLYTDLKIREGAIFYLQNSLFRWDRITRTNKIIRNLRQHFEDTTDVLEKLVSVLVQFDDVSASAFKMSSIIQSRIQGCIVASIQQMVKLLKINRSQRVVAEGLNSAMEMMKRNTKWQKEASITAFKWMEVESTPPCRRSLSNGSYSREDGGTETSPLNNTSANRDTDVKIYSDERDLYSHSSQNSDVKMPSHDSKRENFGMENESNLVSIKSEELQLKKPSKTHISNQKDSHHSDFRLSSKYDKDQHNHDNYHLENVKSPQKYQRQSLKLQVTIDDNEAKSHHQSARQQAERLRDKAVKFAKQHNELTDSMYLLLDDLQINVHKIREVNTDIDLLEKNKVVIHELRDEIQVWADEPGIIECYHAVVSILSKPTSR